MIARRHLTARNAALGFTLVELMIVVLIIGVLAALGIPTYRVWIENNKVRAMAESLQDGLRTARAEAIRLNTNVRFQLVNDLTSGCTLSSSGKYWVVSLADPTSKCNVALSDTTAPQTIKKTVTTQSTTNSMATLTVSASQMNGNTVAATINTLTFTPFGRVADPVQSGVWIDISNSSLATADQRNLRVTITQSGQLRSCDPSSLLASDDPRRC